MYLCHSSFILVIIGNVSIAQNRFNLIRRSEKLTFFDRYTNGTNKKDISSININKAPSVDVLRSSLPILEKCEVREYGIKRNKTEIIIKIRTMGTWMLS